jgi:hypothetical protein
MWFPPTAAIVLGVWGDEQAFHSNAMEPMGTPWAVPEDSMIL